MNNTKNTIDRVFNILHNGNIVACEFKDKNLNITVETEYLTALNQTIFKKFYITLNECINVHFLPWPKSKNEGDELRTINKELNIIKEKNNANTIEVMYQANDSEEIIGGILTFNAKEILIFSEDKKPITVDELQKMIDQYSKNSTN